jgi:hypothetical protein
MNKKLNKTKQNPLAPPQPVTIGAPDNTPSQMAESSEMERSEGQPDTSKAVTGFHVLANANCWAVAEVVVAAMDENDAEKKAQQVLNSARFSVMADAPNGANVVTDLMQENVDIEMLETTQLDGEIEFMAEGDMDKSLEPEKNDSAVLAVVSPRAASEQPFLVIVLDESDDTGCGVVVRAQDSEAAERKALDERKAEHDLSDVDDEAAGFKAVAVFGYEYLVEIVREMEMPEPDVSWEMAIRDKHHKTFLLRPTSQPAK